VAPTVVPYLTVVADPLEFFDVGDGSRTALVLKLHGCARLYRETKARSKARLASNEARPEGNEWERYLRAIVYTYREIQNWREDSWSRDFLCTLLRTRTLVLCGYSAADVVVHDTFRTVYEELSRYRATHVRATVAPINEKAPEELAPQAPAFFLGPQGTWEFHGVEILRAASRAAGARTQELTSHPNYIEFKYVDEAGTAFPTLDDAFTLLFHRVLRMRQEQALQQDLRRIVVQLLGHPPTDGELRTIRNKFSELLEAEKRRASELAAGSSRAEFASLVDWTDQFHVGFLRQVALTEALARRQCSRQRIDELRRVPSWYFPIAERPDWGAWAVVVELALRQMLATHLSGGVNWALLPPSVVVQTTEGAPSISWRRPNGSSTVAIRWEGDPLRKRHTFAGAPRSRRLWEASAEHLPWVPAHTQPGLVPLPHETPDARQIWDLALRPASKATVAQWLEVPDEPDADAARAAS
jgi:hypothetical protein